jgi:hypothetical protein
MYKFLFERSPETLHGGIVETVAFPAHRRFQLELIQYLSILMGAILTATVRMVHQPFGRMLGSYSSE